MEKIDACKNGCMLYWKDNIDLDYCKFCGETRYKPTRERNPNRKKTQQMTRHANHQTEEGSICHLSDAEAWRHFDRTHPDFAAEPCNVILGLCTDGFAPHGQYGRTFSCWPIILTPYNLPPGMCMSSEYMFLTMNLWHVGVLTRDSARDETFAMRAALMWTVNDLPAYGMASGWSSAGVMGCPVCMEDTRAFYLRNGGKACYFDCHR
ncbi:UNVERIFIED_CONTAM: hypothetical protein Slati_1465500 [Sesamum latifolium]|uniref:Uncharacterized protein n=1 Tax=Sesamum latifolium TaxID=2727402 RepID=A0AAW2X659_9LAMI